MLLKISDEPPLKRQSCIGSCPREPRFVFYREKISEIISSSREYIVNPPTSVRTNGTNFLVAACGATEETVEVPVNY